MKVRTAVAGVAATALVAGGGVMLATTAAGAQNATTTLKFTSVKLKKVDLSKTTLVETDSDVSSSGKVLGFDVLHFTVSKTKVTIDGTVDVAGGLIYGTLTSTTSSPKATGKVTGGTGTYKGATGSIKATATSATKTVITIVFSRK